MKASQITTRDRKGIKVVKTLAAVAVLTFFVAGPAQARCRNHERQVQVESRFITTQDRFTEDLGTDFHGLSHVPRIEVLRDGQGYSGDRWGRENIGQPKILLRGLNQPMYGNTTIPISNDTEYRRKREEERRLRRRIVEGLKGAGVIREPGQPATTTKTGNGPGSTTTKPKPKPTPKPTVKPTPKPPKVTKLPNGDRITEYPDGRREIKLKNGDTVTTYKNGKRVIKKFNGDTTETHPSGYRKTTDRYGDGTAHFPDGTRIDFKSSGEATLTTKDGKTFHRMPGKGFKPVD